MARCISLTRFDLPNRDRAPFHEKGFYKDREKEDEVVDSWLRPACGVHSLEYFVTT